jgi:hypothetical protein
MDLAEIMQQWRCSIFESSILCSFDFLCNPNLYVEVAHYHKLSCISLRKTKQEEEEEKGEIFDTFSAFYFVS